jgi:hypothetical protein
VTVEVSKEAKEHDEDLGGRERNAVFNFHPRHILDDHNYVQVLKSHVRVPLMTGQRPHRPDEDASAFAKAKYARYVMTSLVPWSIDEPPVVTWAAFLAWEEHCLNPTSSFLDRCRLRMVRNMDLLGVVDRKRKLYSDRIRQRNRKIWMQEHELDVNFDATREQEMFDEMQHEHRDSGLADSLDDIIQAMRVAQEACDDDPDMKPGSAWSTMTELLSQSGAPSANPSSAAHFCHGDQHTSTYEAIKSVAEALRAEVPNVDKGPDHDIGPELGVHEDTSEPAVALDASQQEVLDRVRGYLALAHASDESARPDAPLIFLHAGPGTGKSETARQLALLLRRNHGEGVVKFVAPTGIAASNLPSGSTCHHGLGLSFVDEDCGKGARNSRKDAALPAICEKFRYCRVVVVDEVSMVGFGMLCQIDRQLRRITKVQAPFGGLCVILMGDFVQLPPVNQTALYHSVKARGAGRELDEVHGKDLFKKFDEITLTGQHRVQGDPHHAEVVRAYRDFSEAGLRIRNEFCDRLEEITAEELAGPEWMDCVIVSTDQRTVHAINELRVRHYAKMHGLPVIAWRLPLSDGTKLRFTMGQAEFLYSKVRDMTTFFVSGVPCCLTQNIRTERGLSNGTPATLKSITLSANEPQATYDRIASAAPGEVVHLEHPPYSVNVVVESDLLGVEPLDTTPEGVVIPLLPTTRAIEINRYVKMTARNVKVRVSAHPYRLIFGATYHGVQCVSRDRIVLCVDSGARPALTYNSWYVGLSRVRQGCNIRVLRLGKARDIDNWRDIVKSLIPRVMLVRYFMSDVNREVPYNAAEEHLREVYQQCGININKVGPIKTMFNANRRAPPRRSKGRPTGPVPDAGSSPASTAAVSQAPPIRYECHVCGQNCASEGGLTQHKNRMHPELRSSATSAVLQRRTANRASASSASSTLAPTSSNRSGVVQRTFPLPRGPVASIARQNYMDLLEGILHSVGLQKSPIAGNGNCFYLALCHQLHAFGVPTAYDFSTSTVRRLANQHRVAAAQARKEIGVYMRRHPLRLLDHGIDVDDIPGYLNRQEKDAEWAGSPEIAAATNLYGVSIHCYTGTMNGVERWEAKPAQGVPIATMVLCLHDNHFWATMPWVAGQ